MRWANLIVDYERDSKRMRNYGDDIQIAAITNLYTRMGVNLKDVVRIKVTDLATYKGEEVILPINYPLYGKYSCTSPKIIPVYLGLSLLSASEQNSLRLQEAQPIGCRDAYTMHQLRNANVEAYLNGCMTLTLPKREKYSGQNKVFIIDACDELLDFVPHDLLAGAEFGTQLHYNRLINERESLAVYDRFKAKACLMITSRLHCAIPCIAFGIPTIYACKEISFRSWWLENIIPLYDVSSFPDIDWNPGVLECESTKEIMLDNAEKRLWEVYDRYERSKLVSSIFESKNAPVYTIEALRSSFSYLEQKWDQDSEHSYVIWGVTQTADILYDYLSQNYPKAKLTGVVDVYREVNFHGMLSGGLDILNNTQQTIFVCSESANVMALDEFEKRGIKDFVLCWEKLDYDLGKQRQ